MNDKRRIVMELLAGDVITAPNEDDLIEEVCRIADRIIEATPDKENLDDCLGD